MKIFILFILVTSAAASENVPDVPLDLKVQAVGSHSINVSWSPPYAESTHPINKYVLQYWKDRASVGEHRLVEKVFSSNQTSAVIKSLRPGITYQFVIAAENEVGRSEPSDAVSFTTAEEEPYLPPLDINVSSLPPTDANGTASLLVTWKPPPKEQWNGKLKGFDVGYKEMWNENAPYSFKTVDYVPDGVQELLVTHLRKDTEYSITVKAFNNAGSGPRSQDIVIRTLGGDTPTTPFELKVQDIWSSSARVSWLVPHNGNNPNTKYVLQYWINTGAGKIYSFKEKAVSSALRSALIEDLLPATDYAVAILAENEMGRSEPSHAISFTTSEDVPFHAPIDINVDATETDTVVVTWKPPPKNQWNGKLKGFHVGYKSIQSYSSFYSYKTVDYVSDGVQECTITHLRNDTEYHIVVRAFNEVGSGPESHEISIRTLSRAIEEVPATPLDLKLLKVLQRSARISWSFPATGNNSNTKFVVQHWMYTDTGSRYRLEENVVSNEQTSLLIENLHPGSNYGLVILAANKAGQSAPSNTVLFKTDESIPSAPPTDVNVYVNGTTSLLVTWKPPPKYEWNGKLKGFYVGYKIMQSDYSPYSYKTVDYISDRVQEYLITDLLQNMEYSIILKAFNKVGSGPASSELVIRTLGEAIKDAPATPLNLKVRVVWSRHALVSWSPPQTGIDSIKYVLQYWRLNEISGRIELEEEVVSRGQASFLIKDLQPGTDYGIAILAENEVGRSEQSDTLLFKTNEEEPRAPPTDVNVYVNGTTSILVTWKSPPKDEWNGITKLFYVRYKMQDSEDSYSYKTVDYVRNEVQKCTITHLQKNTEYSIAVQAFNRVGFGPFSQEVTIRTLGEELPATPVNFKMQEVSATTCNVSWSYPSTGRNSITNYVLQYWKYTAFGRRYRLEEEIVSSELTSALIKNLHPFTNYSIVIVAENTEGRSLPSDVIRFRTYEDKPSESATDVNVKVNGTTFLVTWKPPHKDSWNGELIGFYVGYRKMKYQEPYVYSSVFYVPATVQQRTLKHLERNTEYSVIINAFNNVGAGPPTGEVAIWTLEMPLTPIDLKVQETWSRSVKVSWFPVYKPNIKYVLQYWRETAFLDGSVKEKRVENRYQTSVLIKDLHPATKYYIAILAENEMGRSEPSDTISFITQEEEPSAPPRNVKVEAKGTESLLVTWRPPRKSEWNGQLIGFYVGYKNMQDSNQTYSFKTVDYVPDRIQECMITNLRQDVEYSITVKAFNNVGVGSSSKPVIIRTLGEDAMMNEI